MTLIRWDPWQQLQRLRAETDKLWDEFLDKLAHCEVETPRIDFLPDVDLLETPHEYRLYWSIPGLVEEDIELAIAETSLTVRGERQPPYDPAHSQPQLHEWRYGYFQRQFEFAHTIRPDAVHANYDAGVLTVILPKAESR